MYGIQFLGMITRNFMLNRIHFVLIIPGNAGLDSTYFRILDAADPNYFDSCGIFYLTDTIKPLVAATLPANHKTNIGQMDSVVLAFDEMDFPFKWYNI